MALGRVWTSAPQFLKDYAAFYKTSRGYRPRSLINMPIMAYADEFRSAVLLVHGENAHSRYFSEDTSTAISTRFPSAKSRASSGNI